jgi:superfamily I DNA and/or RNA helicase
MQEQSTLIINKQILPFLNISLYLNDIKPIKSLTIENTSEVDSAQLEIKITSDLPCIEPFNYILSMVPAKKDVKIPLENLKVNRNFFNNLSETEKANITIEVIEQEITILKETISINIQPLEHFGGFHVLPELIAAYVTPNHPYVYHIKRKAIEILEKQQLKTAFEGYQSNDIERVLQIMSAIYSAIQSEDIIYSSLPPGYEETGQRLRMLNTIQQEKFGNCIDISLLFAACLEAVDLNPILIIIRGHAFVGCWLQDDKFSEVINDDKTAITKRLSKGIREMITVEATSVCMGNNIKFSDALDAGEAQLVQKDDFLLSIDIKRARTLRIRPLPLLTNSTGTQLDEEALKQTEMEIAAMENHFEIGTIYQDELLQDKQLKTKQKIWERKLLDLSLRNNLLNLHITRNMLQLVDIDISNLEDTLSDGKSFSIMPNPNAELLRKYNSFSQPLHQSSPLYQLANDELKHNRLLTHYHQQDLDNILAYIHKNAKQAIEENGSSTLYLAVGLLKWFDRKTPEQPRYSPILLLPVEISRRSVNSKFTLKSREEETMINITLVEFLRQEYELNLGGLEQLPTDEKGVDVAKVMGLIRQAIKKLRGWDVMEQLVLGNFSFSKLILWKDIVVHQEDMLKSDMVRSLVYGKLIYNENHEPASADDYDNVNSSSIILPIPADVSQMDAVLAAQKGRSFVLHGPPGTGKSQTITNIIADAMYRGKRVLFVAAKKAALDVVHKRLEQIGLAPYTLEVHSNKSKKSDVLQQMAKSIETSKLARIADFEQEAERLDIAKKDISSCVNLLHQKQQFGWSLYDSISTLENYSDSLFPKDFISETVLQQLNPNLLQQWTDWLPQFQSITKLLIHPSENSLTAFNLSQYIPSLSDDISTDTQKLLNLLPELQNKSQKLANSINFPFPIQSKLEWEQFVQGIRALESLPNIPLELMLYLSDKENYNVYEEWSNIYNQFQTCLKNILKDYKRDVLTKNISVIEIEWKQAQQSWFLPKWLKTRKIKKQLAIYRNTPFSDESELVELFSNNNQFHEVQLVLQQNRFGLVQQSLKNLFKDEQTDLSDIDNKASLVQHLRILINYWDQNGLGKWVQLWQEKNLKYIDEIKENNLLAISDLIQLKTTFNEQKKNYETLTGINFQQTENWIVETETQLQNIKAHLPQLRNWMNYVQLRNQGERLSLNWLISAYENELSNSENITDYFNYTLHASITRSIISQHESLSLFNVDLFESKIEQYKKIAKDFQNLTIQELRIKLAAQLPNTTAEAIQSSEIGILQRAIKNRGRGLSIRKLFDQIPALLPRISPCMLMSPISVAQYFNVNKNHFDILIFDEASQLPTCEAVSALARAKQAIIVGDPKQMPPTSFFSTVKLDEENMDVEDLESILDDCLSLSVPSKYLLRHYRSKHESLIAFSNVNYYENKLLTFPSFDDLNRKVKHHKVKGFYDKGKTRTNKFEADEIVQYIKTHYSDPQKRKLSLGVVTFSQTQQSLIEDKLQNLFIFEPILEELANDSNEPLFVKNLENVQGDERDIILFSVCYAPDEEGKMSMNFGPLNRDGGWRRLNVAVTRARYEMHIYATLQTDQIDLNRTSAEGVAGLKAFLQFAEKGHLSVRPEDVQENFNKQHLSASISKKLKEKGLNVTCNIGTSNFKVDIGIVHPDKPQQYILGIVVDGHYYYNTHTANDREMIMPSMLKALGWNIHRIWTIDWLENSDKIIDTIIEKVKQLQSNLDVKSESMDEPAVERAFESIKLMPDVVLPINVVSKQISYTACTITPISNANSETIYDLQNRNFIKQQIKYLVDTESPISKSLLYKKVLQAWNTSRAGAKLDNHLEGIIKEMNLVKTTHHQLFFWSNNTALDYYRRNDIEKRNIEDIAPEEVLVALQEVVVNNLSIKEDELFRYLARTFGFAKIGSQIDTILRYVIDTAVQNGKVMKENDRIKLADK